MNVISTDKETLRWLHITDLHVGKNNESQRTALTSLIAAIQTHAENKAFDVVFLTGDLAYSGSEGEYAAFEAQVLLPLRAHPLFLDAQIYSVPGNHDLDCDVGYPPAWNSIGASRQEKFFHLDDSGTATRSSRSGAFNNYRNFVTRAGVISVDPTTKPASLSYIEGKARRFAVVSTVTAFFSDKEVSDFTKAPAPVHSIRTLLQEVKPDVIKIVLGHHPGDWFMPDSDRQLHSLLVNTQSIYLHGHEHSVRSRFGGRGLTSIGFGAAYQAPSDGQAVSRYRNSFAICELADALHVKVISWDADNGHWRPDMNLPGDFIDPSDRLAGGFCLMLPTTRITEQANRPYSALASAIRAELHFENCIWLAENTVKRWTELLSVIGQLRNVSETYSLPTQSLPAGHVQFRVKDQRGQYLVYAVSGHGDILNYDQLQTINTELDKQDYDGSIVVTLGALAKEAKTLAGQLQLRKPITVLERDAVVKGALRTFGPSLSRALAPIESTSYLCSLVVTTTSFAVLLEDRTTHASFSVVDSEGVTLPESAELVHELREENHTLKSWRYEATPAQGNLQLAGPRAPNKFDRGSYLDSTRAYFDDVKYAPLAALGFRFRKASLEEIYVDASANVGGTSKASHDLSRAVSEFLESLSLPKPQRDQLESQLRSRYGLEKTSEVGAARQLYQRYNNVIVLGDPGSGKTCFVKHELLAYCDPSEQRGSWYTHHLPIYVALAEAARLLDGKTDMLAICEIVSARRGIPLPQQVISQSLSEGRCAFFFDGLDEVGSIETRISLMAEIDKLVKSYAHRGNRFVIASRPAAVQPVDIPEALTYLQLNGLSDGDMATLATRVLTIRVGDDEPKEASSEEQHIVDRLIADTRNSPGIARLARNPLLLTLLVLIYANTGALSARRHLVYSQAIKTLVSVRGRETREQQISEADLRTRLGAVAVAIFGREIAEIPKRSEVVKVLVPRLQQVSTQSESAKTDAANAFIQEVAEATGLLTIHKQAASASDDLITFMHYSFLEYYAAAGLLSRDYLGSVRQLSGNPRWKDVITLLFGILSEQGDVTLTLREILSDDSPAEAITNYKLLLALECASECDVAPEAAQDMLAEAVYKTIASGAGRYSADLREDLAAKIDYFLQGAGPRVESALLRALTDVDPMVVAACCDLVAHLPEDVVLPSDITRAFEASIDSANPITRAAAMLAIERRPELRSSKAEGLVRASLRRSVVEKHAALKVLSSVPAFSPAAHSDVLELLDDPNVFISQSAAQCLLASAVNGSRWEETAGMQEKVLAKLQQSDHEVGIGLPGVTLDKRTLDLLISSSNPVETELAIRYIPLVRDDDQFVYQTLVACLRGGAPSRHVAAALDSLRHCVGAMNLITIADTDYICGLRKAKERNVRIAALRLLGEMPDDEQVIQNLREHLASVSRETSKEDEVTEAAKALGAHVRRNPRLRDEVLKSVLQHLPKNPESGFGDAQSQQHLLGLLLVCESIGGTSDEGTALQLLKLAESFKTPMPIRRQAMRVYGRVAEPSTQTVSTFMRLLGRSDVRTNDAVYAATASFAMQCRRRVDYVRKVYSLLAALRDQLCTVWRREITNSLESIDQSGLRDIRVAVKEIENLMTSYEEFAERRVVQTRAEPE